jgi:hypothetical protein
MSAQRSAALANASSAEDDREGVISEFAQGLLEVLRDEPFVSHAVLRAERTA